MKPHASTRRASRRTFLKNLGGLLLAGTVGKGLLLAERPHLAPPANAAVAGLLPPQVTAEVLPGEWNELADPGWSG